MLEGVRGWCPLQYTMNLDKAKNIYRKRIQANKNDLRRLGNTRHDRI